MAAQLLIAEGHEVLLHGRDRSRAEEALRAAPGALGAVQGDVASIAQTKALAERVNEAGPMVQREVAKEEKGAMVPVALFTYQRSRSWGVMR